VSVQDLDAVHSVDAEAELLDPGWALYDPVREYQRMGVGLHAPQWRITTANLDYTLCDTYPSVIAVPTGCSDETLAAAAKFRSRGRIPILSYLHGDNMVRPPRPTPRWRHTQRERERERVAYTHTQHAHTARTQSARGRRPRRRGAAWRQGSITRCSQPLAGINGKRSADDEALVRAIFETTQTYRAAPTSPGTGGGGSAGGGSGGTQQQIANLIVDARPRANAYANAAMGKGFESTDNYVNCRREFLGIENIHVMRDSLHAMIEGTWGTPLHTTPPGPARSRMCAGRTCSCSC
jgi:myotubularin-related protein 6/7/8